VTDDVVNGSTAPLGWLAPSAYLNPDTCTTYAFANDLRIGVRLLIVADLAICPARTSLVADLGAHHRRIRVLVLGTSGTLAKCFHWHERSGTAVLSVRSGRVPDGHRRDAFRRALAMDVPRFIRVLPRR